MVQDVTVGLDSFTISNEIDKNICLTVSTKLSLSLPDSSPLDPTPAQLRDEVKAGALWITRAGSCRYALSACFEDMGDETFDASLRDQNRRATMEAFQGFPSWDALGIRLRPDVKVFDRQPNSSDTLTHSVQHTLEQSGLFTPEGITCGYLSEISSRFQFSTRSAYARDQLGDHTRICTLNASPHELRRIARSVAQPSEFRSLSPEQQVERLGNLTYNALDLLVGLKKRPKGVRLLEPFKLPSLLDLAPDIWNATYFQKTVARSKFVPSISSVLAKLATSTQSTARRQRIEDLVQGSSSNPQLENVPDKIQKRLLALLLRSTYAHRAKLSRRRATATRLSQEQARELILNDQAVDLDESQASPSMELMYDTPVHDGKHPYMEADDTEYFDDLNENARYIDHDGEQSFLLSGRMYSHSDHVYDEDAQANSSEQRNIDLGDLDSETPMEDTQLYTTSMTSIVADMERSQDQRQGATHTPVYNSYTDHMDQVEDGGKVAHAHIEQYSQGEDQVPRAYLGHRGAHVLIDEQDPSMVWPYSGEALAFVAHRHIEQYSQGEDQVPIDSSRPRGAHFLIDEQDLGEIWSYSDESEDPGFIPGSSVQSSVTGRQ